jgi:hypothetical protein
VTASTSSVTAPHRALALPVAVGCGAVGAAGYVAARDPASTGTYPQCVFRSVTGLWCPGCGLTRAAHHLLHGDIERALGYNALVLPVGGLLVITWVAWLMGTGGHRPAWVQRAALPAWVVLAAVAVTFTIVRNIPAFDVLRG